MRTLNQVYCRMLQNSYWFVSSGNLQRNGSSVAAQKVKNAVKVPIARHTPAIIPVTDFGTLLACNLWDLHQYLSRES